MTNEKYYTAETIAEEDLAASYDLNFNMTVNGDNNNVSGMNFLGNIFGDTAKMLGGFFDANTTPEVTTIDSSESTGEEFITGNAKDNTIIVGNDAATVNGYAGNNTTNFGYGWGAKRYDYSVFEGFSSVFNYSATRGDVIGYSKGLASWFRNEYGLALNATDGTSLTVMTGDSVNQAFNLDFGNGITRAKIAKQSEAASFTQETNTILIGNVETQDTVKVYSSTTESTYTNLNEYSSIEYFDGSQAQGNVIAIGQNGVSNTLAAGAGSSSLWGGAEGGNDVLISGTGQTTVFYGQGNGNDVLIGSKETDVVNLMSDVSLAQISYAGQISSEYFAIGLTSGETLYMDGNKDRIVNLQNQTFKYEAASASWSSVTQVTTA